MVALVTLAVAVFVVIRRRQRNLDQANESITNLNASLAISRQDAIDSKLSLSPGNAYAFAGEHDSNETYM